MRRSRSSTQSDVPIFAICLGHQLMALANGMDTYKLKYGHRGGNHPVKDLETGRVYISSQNHGYVVDTGHRGAGCGGSRFCQCQRRHQRGPEVYGEKYFHRPVSPGGLPGPQDSAYLFDRFLKMMEVND